MGLLYKQEYKFFKEQQTTKGMGDWWRTSQRRNAKISASKIDLEQPYDNFTIPYKEPKAFKLSNKWDKLLYSPQ